jgi:hypothetical protein
MESSEYSEDPPLSDSELQAAHALSAEQVAEIDTLLLSHVDGRWRKVALVVARVIRELGDRHPELSDVYFALRIAELVQQGSLESEGNLRLMRFSEVRLPQMPGASAA